MEDEFKFGVLADLCPKVFVIERYLGHGVFLALRFFVPRVSKVFV